MAIDVMRVMDRVEAGEVELYYGFDPDAEYVIRSANREYVGTAQSYYTFALGQVIAGRMRPNATETQKWERGERLNWFKQEPAYRVYRRGTEPSRDEEPMWAHYPPEGTADSGEMSGEMPAWAPLDEPDPDGPETQFIVPRGDAGEAMPTPETTSAKAQRGTSETGDDKPLPKAA